MGKKRKPIIPEGLPKGYSDSELVELLGESIKEADKLTNPYPQNNNGSSNEVIQTGFYLKYKKIYFFNGHYGDDGLEERDVKKIAGQLEEVCGRCILNVREDYVLVRTNEERFYVHVNDLGEVRLPELVGSNPNGPMTERLYGKTDDPEKVLGLAEKVKKTK